MKQFRKIKKKKLKTAKDILISHDFLENREKSAKYVTKEYQDYGLRLAHTLGDTEHKSLYIKLAKSEKRQLLEKALSFTADYPNARNKGKIFMWKLKGLRIEQKQREQEIKQKAKESQAKFF